MKKAFAFLLCLFLLLGALQSASAFEIIVGGIIYDYLTATDTPAPATPVPTNPPFSGNLGDINNSFNIPIVTPKATLGIGISPGDFSLTTPKINLPEATPKPADPAPKPPAATPKPTAKPKPPSGSLKGAEATSFGLYFEDFRPRLTDAWYMFTPINLGQEGTLTYPLVAENAWIIGSVTLTVRGGKLTVTYETLKGVSVTRDFFTVVGTLDNLPTVNPTLLAGQKLPFNQPIDIAANFGTDRLVVLYLNNSVNFKTNLAGVTAFVPEQHQLFMQNLVALVD